jgi:hypothetical protein
MGRGVLKTLGYLISTLSVILLAIVSWKATASEPLLRGCLIAGALASVLGMFCRWLSYELEKKHRRSAERRGGSAAVALSSLVRAQGD